MSRSSIKALFLLAAFLLFFSFLSVKASDRFLPLFFEGKKVAGDKLAACFQNELYLPLSFFSDYLHTVAGWNEETGDIQLQVGSYSIKLKEASKEIIWGTERRLLSTAPRRISGELWLPVEVAFHLGVKEKNREDGLLSLGWEENYLLSVKKTTYQGRQAFLFQTAREFTYDSFLLTDPARLVIDFKGVKPHPRANMELPAEPPVEGIRSSVFTEEKLRVVFDLTYLVGYRILASAENRTELQIVFDSFLKDGVRTAAGEDPSVYVDTSHPVDYRTTLLTDPHRVVVDIWDATLIGEAINIPGDGKWVERIRISQFDPHIIRIVLDIKEPRNCIVTTAGNNRNRLEIKTTREEGTDGVDGRKESEVISAVELQEESRHDRVARSPLAGKVILLDPGHGGIDAGAIGSKGVREKEINLDVALRLQKLLEEAGARVVMTRDDDFYIGLYERAAVANRVGAALAVSLHVNSHPDSRVHGFEIFHHPDCAVSRCLAENIFAEMTTGTGLRPISVKTNKDLVFTRETQMPAVLVEMGFLSNAQEEILLRQSDLRKKLALSLYQGILNYCTGEK